jgi:hypothetical protein
VGAISGQQSAFQMQVTDLFGRTILEFENIFSFPFIIDISGLNSGIYILHLIEEGRVTGSAKFIKISA